jgi:aspartyl-tRNA(Asn)/glutamyl-tRNA(Gln) amidotransferase subunit A
MPSIQSLLQFMSIKSLSEMIRNREVSPSELVENILERIRRFNRTYNAFISILDDQALEAAYAAEEKLRKNIYQGIMHGIPFSVKDMFFIKGVRCTAGSRVLDNFVPEYDSLAINIMKNAGAILIGSNNLNEFASGITGINRFFGNSRNPWDTSRISGGSSGGSAVAVSTGMVPIALGTDTGGSVRVPASLCGVVGIKPTYGMIPRDGVLDLSPSLDHLGFITRSVWDATALVEILSSRKIRKRYGDGTFSLIDRLTRLENELESIKGTRIGLIKGQFTSDLDQEIEKVFYKFVGVLGTLGILSDDLRIQSLSSSFKCWNNIRLSEASEVHLQWLAKRSAYYSRSVRKMLMEGLEIPAVDYIKALRHKKLIMKEMLKVMRRVDALVVPTTCTTAPTIVDVKRKPRKIRNALLRNNFLFNLTGFPAITIPVALTKSHLPVGVQIVGRPGKEEKILSIAYAFELINKSTTKFVPRL